MNREGPPRNGSTPDWSRGSLNRQNEKSKRQNITASEFVVEPLCSRLGSLRVHDRSQQRQADVRRNAAPPPRGRTRPERDPDLENIPFLER
jgi:hypothetical protein